MKKKIRVVKNFKIVKRSCSLNRYYRVVEDLDGILEFKDDDFSERSSLCVLFQNSLVGLVSSFCILVVSSGPSKFDFYTEVCLLRSKHTGLFFSGHDHGSFPVMIG